MTRKNIKVYEDTFEKLKELQERGESMDKVISDLLETEKETHSAERLIHELEEQRKLLLEAGEFPEGVEELFEGEL